MPNRMTIIGIDPDKEWERIGRTEPYFGVLESEEMKGRRPPEDKLSEFFSQGERDVERLLGTMRSRFDPDFAPEIALDYGCGVGRVLVPLARHCRKVIGMDISDSMMAEASLNCGRFGVNNAEFIKADDALSRLEGQVDMVHTHEVLQHIPVKRGMAVIGELVDHLAEGGMGYIEFPYMAVSGRAHEAIRPLFYRSSVMYGLANIVTGGGYSDRKTEMNQYDLDEVLRLLLERGIGEVLVSTERMGHFLTAEVFFQRPVQAPAPFLG